MCEPLLTELRYLDIREPHVERVHSVQREHQEQRRREQRLHHEQEYISEPDV